jgi:uncharacterized protein HemX
MTKTLWAIALLAVIALAGAKAYRWIEATENDRFHQRDQMVHKIAEDRAAEAARVLHAGEANRAAAIAREIDAAQRTSTLDSLLSR